MFKIILSESVRMMPLHSHRQATFPIDHALSYRPGLLIGRPLLDEILDRLSPYGIYNHKIVNSISKRLLRARMRTTTETHRPLCPSRPCPIALA
jgi:hypothetical protein